MNKETSLQRLVVSSMMIGLAAVLSMIRLFRAPMEGSVTFLSMLPICMLSIRYGVKWGVFSAFVYSLVQLMLSFGDLMSWGLTKQVLLGSAVFDYFLAFSVLGLSGMFRKHGTLGVCGGITLALILRFLCHVVSGVLFFSIWAWEGWNPLLYSICYNGAFMLPECILTASAAWALCKLPKTAKYLLGT